MLYGSLNNRLMENHDFVPEITVGTGMTEYSYTDREAYEVVEVTDQKHVKVRRLDHVHVGDGEMDNMWELVSNEDNPVLTMVKRGKCWYYATTLTKEDLPMIEADAGWKLRACLAGFDFDRIRSNGKQIKYFKANVSFGIADYHYDYEF